MDAVAYREVGRAAVSFSGVGRLAAQQFSSKELQAEAHKAGAPASVPLNGYDDDEGGNVTEHFAIGSEGSCADEEEDWWPGKEIC